MPSSVSPMIVTHDLERLARFYTGLTGATEATRVPDEGPTFYLGLQPDGNAVNLTTTSA